MIKINYTFKSEIGKAIQASDRAASRFLFKMGALMRRAARRYTNKKGGRKAKPSEPGEPWHKGTGALRNAIVFDKQYREVTLGFLRFGKTAELHEFGGTRRVNEELLVYPARPVIEPSFEQAKTVAMKIMPDVYRRYFPKA